jgi:pimeloyl-ACP methyl ester carboxylesterase
LAVVFGLTCTLVFFAAKLAAYPGVAAALPSEERPPEAKLNGEEFVFEIRKEGALLQGYRALFSNEDTYGGKALANNTNITRVVPVVMIGGNGGSMWFNVFAGDEFVMDEYLERDQTVAFDIFAFSYRGYAPNEFSVLQVNEATMIQDSLSLFKYVQQKYPNAKPLLFSHSMGTGSASALASILDSSEVACIGLGMPFSSLRQTMLEVSLYAIAPFFFLLDSWNSYQRLSDMEAEIPLAILSAGQDHLIAPHQQRELYERATSASKKIFYKDHADHGAILETIRHNKEEYAKWFRTSCMDRTFN